MTNLSLVLARFCMIFCVHTCAVGFWITRRIAATGATVIMACRNLEAAKVAKQQIVDALTKEGMTDVEDRIKVPITNGVNVCS
jgi:NADP-dependent 3-hydroxy acid dehydrogenase YdfG